MFSRQESSRIRQEFWTAFGQYMAPVLSAEGERINWVNYKTGEQHIYFRMDAGNRGASISIVIAHNDAGIRELYYEQFLQLRAILHGALGEAWNWVKDGKDNSGKPISYIFTELPDVSIFRREDWPAMIGFLKPRIIALDEFWSNARYAFEAFR